jgi:hypothetical protein
MDILMVRLIFFRKKMIWKKNNQSLIPKFPLAGIENRYFKITNQIIFQFNLIKTNTHHWALEHQLPKRKNHEKKDIIRNQDKK